jgi:transposase
MARSVRPVELSDRARKELKKLSNSPDSRLSLRAKIVLATAVEDMTHQNVAEQLETVEATVRRWRRRFESQGVQGLLDAPRSGAPKAELVVTDQQRTELERLEQRARTNRDIAFRAKIILAAADGITNSEVAKRLRTTPGTVGKWRRQFVSDGVDGLFDEPRPGVERKISDEDVESIIVQTLESKPKGRTHWSTRKMAEHAGISHSTVGRIWRTFGLQPHVVEGFKLSDDPLFVEKVRDIVGLYLNPPDNAVVLALDEKPQIQALERAQPVLPMDFGQPERQTHNYFRHGTLDLFAALDIVTGKVIARTKKQHRAKDLVAFLRVIDNEVKPEFQVHVILDNLSAHKAPQVKRWLARHPRFHFHFTPTYSSWLNLVERFFALLTEHALRRGSHTSVNELRAAIETYIDSHNEEGKPFVWTKTADEILEKVKRFGQRTMQIHHEDESDRN